MHLQHGAPPRPVASSRQGTVASSVQGGRAAPLRRQRRAADRPGVKYDLVLSSGFLAFANHCGFLQAVEDVGLPVNGIMGTSAGALIGSMYAAGYSPREIVAEFARHAPIERLRCHGRPWEGLLTMEPLIQELHSLLPPSFSGLQQDFACGVVAADGRHVLLDRGSLPAAVSASAAIPVVFHPVPVPDRPEGPFIDGGIKCRIGLDLWRQHRYGGDASAAAPAVVHLIGRSSPFSGNDSTNGIVRQNAVVVKSPKAGVSFWSYGDYEAQFEAARQRALPVLRQLLESQGVESNDAEGGLSSSSSNGAVPAPPGLVPHSGVAAARQS